jgi:hypothetical protein
MVARLDSKMSGPLLRTVCTEDWPPSSTLNQTEPYRGQASNGIRKALGCFLASVSSKRFEPSYVMMSAVLITSVGSNYFEGGPVKGRAKVRSIKHGGHYLS